MDRTTCGPGEEHFPLRKHIPHGGRLSDPLFDSNTPRQHRVKNAPIFVTHTPIEPPQKGIAHQAITESLVASSTANSLDIDILPQLRHRGAIIFAPCSQRQHREERDSEALPQIESRPSDKSD